jgi:hypothetical protein
VVEDISNGGRITTKEFYDRLQENERRVLNAIACLDEKVDQDRVKLAAFEERTLGHGRRLDSHATKIENLQTSDRRWGGFNALLVALGSTIAAIVGLGKNN